MPSIKLATINIWRYYDWEKRLPKLLRVLERYDPDVIALQEVQLNPSFSSSPQSLLLAKSLGYQNHVFCPTMQKTKQLDPRGNMTAEASHGLAIVSRLPILSAESIHLTQQPGDKEPRSVLLAQLDSGNGVLDICNLHFSNSDKFASMHLKETLKICRLRSLQPILLGDFNIFDLAGIDGYNLSSDVLEYESYPKDSGTLDYIALPEKFSFVDVKCPDAVVSDHRIVIAEINYPNTWFT